MKNQRVYIASVFEVQKKDAKEGDKPSHYDISLGVANDLGDPKKNEVMADPMLAYNQYEKNGEKRVSHTIRYAASQYDKMLDAANKDGKYPVLEADLFPTRANAPKRGLMVNTQTLKTPEKAFDHEKHLANTTEIRDIKKEAREAKAAEAAAAKEAEAKEAAAAKEAAEKEAATPKTEEQKREERNAKAREKRAAAKAAKEAAAEKEPDLEM